MRVLMLAIRYDVEDWATGFIPDWARRIAGEVAHLDVLALEVGSVGELPPNMRVFGMGKGPGVGRATVLSRTLRQLAALVPHCDVVFVHMIPRYALIAAPFALALRKPMTLWYTHREPSADLRRALPLLRHVVTAVPNSFPIETSKLHVLGHGIDTSVYAPAAPPPSDGPLVVQVARLQPIKAQDVLLRAVAQVPEAHAALIGAVHPDEGTAYAESLHVQAAPFAERVTFVGGLPAEQVRGWYHRAAVAVNLSPPGLFDKAALESMACGVPTLVSSPAFADLLGDWRDMLLLAHPVDADVLAERLRRLLAVSDDERRAIGADLRARVQSAHSLDALIPRLVGVLAR